MLFIENCLLENCLLEKDCEADLMNVFVLAIPKINRGSSRPTHRRTKAEGVYRNENTRRGLSGNG